VSTKTIVIHRNSAVQEWIGGLKPDWDVQIPVTSANEVWDLLESGQLSPESEIVFISDLLYAETPEDFATVVASFAPTALVIITVEDASLMEAINASVLQAVEEFKIAQGPYYFLDTSVDDPAASIDTVIGQYQEFIESITPAPEATVEQIENYDPVAAATNPQVPTITNVPTGTGSAPSQTRFTPEEIKDSTYTAEELLTISNNLGEPGFILSSTSSKGGSGKTTTAVCTAITISLGAKLAVQQGVPDAKELKVCVVDMDVRDGQIGFSINQQSPSILTLYLEEELTLDTVNKHIIPVDRFGISCLLAPKRGRTADYLTPQFYLEVLHKLRLMFDVIILDTSVNYLDPLLRQVVYPESDAILLVTNLSKGAVLGMPRWMDEVTSGEDGTTPVEKEKIGVVINQSLGGVGMDLNLVRKAAKGAPLLVAIPADNRAVTKASNEGTLHDLIRKHETIGANYFTLAQKVWRKTPLASPLAAYLSSEEKLRDDKLAANGKVDNSSAVSAFTPLSEADKKKPGLFRRKDS
jgi:cellulose biosynthesis protein BcsQ